MLLNKIEFIFMNSSLKAFIQKKLQAPVWKKIAEIPETSGKALEIGCGRGVGVEIILNQYKANEVDAFDLDTKMIHLAKKRLRQLKGLTRLWVGDATNITVPDSTYNSVFDFGAIHHIPDWRKAVKEVHRVLKPDGYFYALEILKDYLNSPIPRKIFNHPHEDRFNHDMFKNTLETLGFIVLGSRHLKNYIAWFVCKKKIIIENF